MKKLLISGIIIVALALGVGGGYLALKALSADRVREVEQGFPYSYDRRGMPFGQRGRGSGAYGPGMMDPRYAQPGTSLERISLDDAAAAAQKYASKVGDNLQVTEVMEFEANFYVVVKETDTGKGAFELLIDPYTGSIAPEMGPNRMWNTKYGHMRAGTVTAANPLTMDEALSYAQKALDQETKGAVVSADGIDFYGYYSFDYEIDGEVAGMLSVNGTDGRVWFHDWHGVFVTEKEITQ